MEKFVGFLSDLIKANKKIVLTVQFNNGSHLYLAERFDGYEEYDDFVELYNYDNDMSLLIEKESVITHENGEFEITLGDSIISLSNANEVM